MFSVSSSLLLIVLKSDPLALMNSTVLCLSTL